MSPEKEKIENMQADMVIIGSGGGLVAAVMAAEKGVKNIVVLEKQAIIGGHSNWAQGLEACDSAMQKAAQVAGDRDERFKQAMSAAHWDRIDPRIARAYLQKSGETIGWFQEKGVHFDLKVHAMGNSIHASHWPLKGKGPEYGRGAALIRALTREAKEQGITVMLRTRGKKILRDAQGITGVVAVKGGQEFEIKTGCVIIATGGFGGSKKLLKKYCAAYYDGMHIREMSEQHTGDGLLMAAEVGAAIPDQVAHYVEGPHPNYTDKKDSLSASIKEPISGIIKEPYTVWVNKKGRRFIDEGDGLRNFFECGNAILMQPDKVVYSLFDDQIRQNVEEHGMLVGRGWGKDENAQRMAVPGFEEVLRRRDAMGGDTLVKIADTLDELADWIGADPKVLKAEIEEYNSFCDHGYDAILGKDRKFLVPLRKPPYYAIRCITSLGGTLGGIKVNERMEVIDTQFNVIPGLLVAGVAADGWAPIHTGVMGLASAFGFAMNSGRIAGESAADYVLNK
jgi:fumarate reductase flavoprotein subunit